MFFLDTSWTEVIKASNGDSLFDKNAATERSYFDLSDRAYGIPYNKYSMPIEKHLNEIYGDRNIGIGSFGIGDQYNQYDNELQMEESKFYPSAELNLIRCKVDLIDTACPHNEECVQLVDKSKEGVCNCLPRFFRTSRGNCVKQDPIDDEIGSSINRENLSEKLLLMKSINDNMSPYENKADISEIGPVDIKKISVSVVSKDVQLPEKEATLAAYTIPDQKSSGVAYKYAWTLISQPSGDVNGTMSDQSKDKIKLSNLSEGLYRFKVVVQGKGLYGEAFANVTVLPEKRINKAPDVIITPKQQIVKIPTSVAILDGSTSKVYVY